MKKVLITGANGFIGKNLRDVLSRRVDADIVSFDLADDWSVLENGLKTADYVYHLAGINRPNDVKEFELGNVDFTGKIIELLRGYKRNPVLIFSSSVQAELDNFYGSSKKKAEELVLEYGRQTGAAVFVYRLPNVFGKWCRPNYNSVVATFCHNISNGLDISISDVNREITLVYIDDVVASFVSHLDARTAGSDKYLSVHPVYKTTLGDLTDRIYAIRDMCKNPMMPLFKDELGKKLYSTFISYLGVSGRSAVNKIKIATVIGTRPEIIRLSRIIAKLDQYAEHILIHTGQNYDYELNEVFFNDMEIRKPDYFLDAAGKNAAITIGNTISKIDPIFEKEKPEAVLVLGDTNSSLAVIPAKRRHIPIFHMEAGNRCFDQRVPEEINRKIVDHISDINMPYSYISRDYLLREGLSPDRVIITGSPMYEVLSYYAAKISESAILSKLKLDEESYFVVSFHREENVDAFEIFEKFIAMLNGLSDIYNRRVIVSTHPRTRKMIDISHVKLGRNIELLKPLGFFDYVKLQTKAIATLSDSGTITEESSILNFPALNIREAHERPEGMEEASVMMVGMDMDRICQGLDILKNQKRGSDRLLRLVTDYDSPNVSDKVLRIILSYTNYVDARVWCK